jgi:hypothetical protein
LALAAILTAHIGYLGAGSRERRRPRGSRSLIHPYF